MKSRVRFRNAADVSAIPQRESWWRRLVLWLRPQQTAAEPSKPKRMRLKKRLYIAKCEACGQALRMGEFVSCPASPHHRAHKACVEELTKGKCPICGHRIES